ncbi:hypothetical protein Acr_08g0011730 [Actinidia rufa]|uniref:RRM domain-containing protein n=1 Tax=Actinidia rufa TaxID=165716 RepID=A0A7J0F4C7_9ERIC|nr:hypothetical protein Acr_08g0011730 [Actinidia rufa]
MAVEPPTNNLWVGNLSAGVTDSELMNLFSKHGVVQSVKSFSSRHYAFVHFNRIVDAMAALEALQGTILRGNSIKIDFVRPKAELPLPNRRSWVFVWLPIWNGCVELNPKVLAEKIWL